MNKMNRISRKQLTRKQINEKMKRYGLTADDYFSMLIRQHGVCAICKRPETKPLNKSYPTGFTGTFMLSVDHDHKTGKVRGLLCSRCNSGLGLFEDDETRLRLAAEYLESKQ